MSLTSQLRDGALAAWPLDELAEALANIPGGTKPGAQMMSIRPVVCPGTIMLTDTEHAMLLALPHPAHEVARERWCELENGHAGLHHTLGQVSLDEAWWLRWNDEGDRRELTALADCSVEEASENPEPCALPAGHAGAHSFEYDRAEPLY